MPIVLSHPTVALCYSTHRYFVTDPDRGLGRTKALDENPGWGPALPLLTVTLDKAVKLSFIVYKMGKIRTKI